MHDMLWSDQRYIHKKYPLDVTCILCILPERNRISTLQSNPVLVKDTVTVGVYHFPSAVASPTHLFEGSLSLLGHILLNLAISLPLLT